MATQKMFTKKPFKYLISSANVIRLFLQVLRYRLVYNYNISHIFVDMAIRLVTAAKITIIAAIILSLLVDIP